MGLKIDRNKKGLYKLTSTISDERLHDKLWITEKEAKKILIERKWFNFVEEVIQIYMQFPDGYQVNGRFERGDKCVTGLEFITECLKSDNSSDKIYGKFLEICKDLDIVINTKE